MKKCDECGGAFKNAHGIAVHKMRSKTCGENTPDASRPRGANGESGREAIRDILASSPQGLPVNEIFVALKKRGLNLNPNFVSQAASRDKSIKRIGRGIYRLKTDAFGRLEARTGTTIVEEAVAEATAISLKDMPVEALMLRIETLETQNRAFHNAHLELMKGIIA